MSNCSRCGAYIPVDETACPACGFDPAAEEKKKTEYSYGYGYGGAASAGAQAQEQEQTQQDEPHADEPQQEEKNVENWEPWAQNTQRGGTAQGDPRRLSVLSYVGPLFLIPLLLHKDDPFVRFHANQGLVLFLLELLVGMLLSGWLWVAGSLFCVYCLVTGAKNVAAGLMEKLPLIGDVSLIK